MFQKHLLSKFGFDTDENEPSKALVTIYFKRCVSLQVIDLAPPTERFMVDARGLRFFFFWYAGSRTIAIDSRNKLRCRRLEEKWRNFGLEVRSNRFRSEGDGISVGLCRFGDDGISVGG